MSEQATSSSSDSAIFKDRRGFPRRRPRGTAAFVPADKPMAPSTAVTLVNLSQGGVSFHSRKALAVGQRLSLDLSAPGIAKPLNLQAHVKWIREEGEGKFHIGCAWTQRVNYGELIRFF
jgi:PilZ domain